MERTSPASAPLPASVPRWLRLVMIADRTLSAWFIGCGFGFGPLLLAIAPTPWATTTAVTVISVAALWLGLLGVGMAWGLGRVLHAGDELPFEFWSSVIALPPAGDAVPRGARQ